MQVWRTLEYAIVLGTIFRRFDSFHLYDMLLWWTWEYTTVLSTVFRGFESRLEYDTEVR